MEQPLAGKNIVILIANGFEEHEMTETHRALLKAGANVRTVSPEQGLVNGWHGAAWGHYFPVDFQMGDVLGADYDCLFLPGGARSIAKLNQTAHTKRIVGHFLDAGKPIAAMGEGVSLMAVPGKLRGRVVAAAGAAAEALTQAGGRVSQDAFTSDDCTVTALNAESLEDFVAETIRLFSGASAVLQAA